VDVRDVAIAHVLAYENASANGRYLLVERVIHYSDVVKMISHMCHCLMFRRKKRRVWGLNLLLWK